MKKIINLVIDYKTEKLNKEFENIENSKSFVELDLILVQESLKNSDNLKPEMADSLKKSEVSLQIKISNMSSYQKRINDIKEKLKQRLK